jgi:hypothetical protein
MGGTPDLRQRSDSIGPSCGRYDCHSGEQETVSVAA